MDWLHYYTEISPYDPSENIENIGHSVEILLADKELYDAFKKETSFSNVTDFRENSCYNPIYHFIYEYNVDCYLEKELDVLGEKKLYDLSEYEYVIYSAVSHTLSRNPVVGVSKLYDRNKNELEFFYASFSGLIASYSFLYETLNKFMGGKELVKVAFVSSLKNEMNRIANINLKKSISQEKQDRHKDTVSKKISQFLFNKKIEVDFYSVSKKDYIAELENVKRFLKSKLKEISRNN